jgi:hypothetical protein
MIMTRARKKRPATTIPAIVEEGIGDVEVDPDADPDAEGVVEVVVVFMVGALK